MTLLPSPLRVSLIAVLAMIFSSLLAGCGVGAPGTGEPSVEVAGLQGMAHGGQQPISGAVVSLMAPGQTGYGSAPAVLATAVTNSAGGFTLPAYTCPAPTSTLVYITATGGNAGAGVNALIGEAAVLGPCSSLSSSTFINITEATTIAAAYTLAPFATVSASATNIGSSATNLTGLNNAFGAASNLVPFTSGVANASGAVTGLVLPTAEINTLADVIAACVNTSTNAQVTTPCTTLLSNTTVSGVAPANTFQAALNIALHPGTNVSNLYTLSTANPPYQPALSSAPADFSIAIGYNGGGITLGGGTISVAIDAAGDAWITTGYLNANVHSLTEISPAGVYLSGSTVAASTGFGSSVLSNPIGLAIDTNGFVDVADNSPAAIIRFNPNGTYNSTITAASLSGPNSIAIDGNNYIWIANFGGTQTTRITPAGVEASNSPITVNSVGVDIAAGPLAIWETDHTTNYVSRIDLSSFAVTSYNTGGSSGGVAIDHNNTAWFASTGTGNLFDATNTGGLANPFGGYVLTNVAQGVAVDGLGNIFVSSYNSENGTTVPGTLVEFNNSGTAISSISGYICSNVVVVDPEVVRSMSADGSGNIWIAGYSAGSSLPNYVTEVIGVAAPVVTPLSLAAKNNTLGVRP